MRALVLSVALGLGPAAALASCPTETLVSCPIGKKQLEVCLTGSTVQYRFGPAGRPELSLFNPIETVDYVPWNGIGRYINDMVVFHNAATSYEVWVSLDKMDTAADYTGGINVLRGGALLAQLTCNPGPKVLNLTPLSFAKEAVGQCWDPGMAHWGRCIN